MTTARPILRVLLAISPLWGCGNVAVDHGFPEDRPEKCNAVGEGAMIWARSTPEVDSQEGWDILLDPAEDLWQVGGFEKSTNYMDLFVARLDSTGETLWRRNFDGEEGHHTNVWTSQLAASLDGGAIVGGVFSRTLVFGGDVLKSFDDVHDDGYLAKLDAEGNPVWSKQIGAEWDDWVLDVGVDAQGNVVVVGQIDNGPIDLGGGAFTGPAHYLVSYDPDGNHRWSRVLGHHVSALAIDAGHLYLAGLSVVSKLDLDGTEQWRAEVPQELSYSPDIAVDPFGNVFLASDGIAKLDPEGNLLWTRPLKGYDVSAATLVADGCGDVVVAGSYGFWTDFGDGELEPDAASDVFVLKLNAVGDRVWLRRGVGVRFEPYNELSTDSNAAIGLALDTDDNLLVSGRFGHTFDFMSTTLTAPEQEYTAWGEYDVFVAKLSR